MQVNERHRNRIFDLQSHISDPEGPDPRPRATQENSATASSQYSMRPFELLQHVKDLRISLLVFVCSICKLLDKDIEQEKAILRNRLNQYFVLPSDQGPTCPVSSSIRAWEQEFDSALTRLAELDEGRTADVPSVPVIQEQNLGLRPLSVDLIEEIMPVHLFRSRFASEADSEHCSVCLQSFKNGCSYVRVFPSCQHTFHSTCLDTWLTEGNIFFNQHGHRCPNCRGTL